MTPTDSDRERRAPADTAKTGANAGRQSERRRLRRPYDDIFESIVQGVEQAARRSEFHNPCCMDPEGRLDGCARTAGEAQYLEEPAADEEAARLSIERIEARLEDTKRTLRFFEETNMMTGDEERWVNPDKHLHDRRAAQDNARFREEPARRR